MVYLDELLDLAFTACILATFLDDKTIIHPLLKFTSESIFAIKNVFVLFLLQQILLCTRIILGGPSLKKTNISVGGGE